ncbi:hypothetical protein B0O99DRAFT_599203 [Bisporella sp. PMI_857]|nr:hypothetical protein B0O99DRAFT_599203 [Bisporella sp. PMI_857]
MAKQIIRSTALSNTIECDLKPALWSGKALRRSIAIGLDKSVPAVIFGIFTELPKKLRIHIRTLTLDEFTTHFLEALLDNVLKQFVAPQTPDSVVSVSGYPAFVLVPIHFLITTFLLFTESSQVRAMCIHPREDILYIPHLDNLNIHLILRLLPTMILRWDTGISLGTKSGSTLIFIWSRKTTLLLSQNLEDDEGAQAMERSKEESSSNPEIIYLELLCKRPNNSDKMRYNAL